MILFKIDLFDNLIGRENCQSQCQRIDESTVDPRNPHVPSKGRSEHGADKKHRREKQPANDSCKQEPGKKPWRIIQGNGFYKVGID